jgi:hypothetical protein
VLDEMYQAYWIVVQTWFAGLGELGLLLSFSFLLAGVCSGPYAL